MWSQHVTHTHISQVSQMKVFGFPDRAETMFIWWTQTGCVILGWCCCQLSDAPRLFHNWLHNWVCGRQSGRKWVICSSWKEWSVLSNTNREKKNFPFWVSSDFLKTGTAHSCLCSASRPLNYINGCWDGSPIYLGAPQPLWSKLIGNSKASLSCALQKRGKKTPWRSCFWE